MITFDPVTHTYKNTSTGAPYTSVTTLLGKYEKPFEADLLAARVAKREGSTPEEVKEKWRINNVESQEYGKKIHKAIENYLKTGSAIGDSKDIVEAYVCMGLVTSDDNVLSEEILYSHRYRIAGTADIVKLENKGTFSVFDIKTNKVINLYSKYGDFLLHPLEHLTSAEYTRYGLQLSLYAFIYSEMTGRVLNQLGIQHYDRQTKSFRFYPVPYLKTDIVNLLEHYANK
jgi:hypothetical protein